MGFWAVWVQTVVRLDIGVVAGPDDAGLRKSAWVFSVSLPPDGRLGLAILRRKSVTEYRDYLNYRSEKLRILTKKKGALPEGSTP
jgi:hypothetical protein